MRNALICFIAFLSVAGCRTDSSASAVKDAAPAASAAAATPSAKQAVLQAAGIKAGLYKGVQDDGSICEIDMTPSQSLDCFSITVKKRDLPIEQLGPNDLIQAQALCLETRPQDCSAVSSASANAAKIGTYSVAEVTTFSMTQLEQDAASNTLSLTFYQGGTHFIQSLSCLSLKNKLFLNKAAFSCSGLKLQN